MSWCPRARCRDSKLTARSRCKAAASPAARAKLTVRESGKVLASQDVTFKDERPAADARPWSSTAARPGPKTLEISVDPVGGRRESSSTTRSRAWSTWRARKPRILYIEGEPRWEYKFIRRAVEDYPDLGIELPSMLRTTQNKIYRQGIKDSKELEDGFPAKPEELFAYQGLIIGSVEASYFTRHAAAGDSRFRGPARRRPAVPGRTRLAVRWRLAEFAAGRPGSGAGCPMRKGTFHRDFSSVSS